MGSSSDESDFDWSQSAGLSSSNFSIGGGRVDGSFFSIAEPGAYEDFTYPCPFQLEDTPADPAASAWFPSLFTSPPAVPRALSQPRLEPVPPTLVHDADHASTNDAAPPPLLDSTESSLFSTFLTTLDVDPKFLFNPVLPPGMPSPPSSSLLPSNAESYRRDGHERDELGSRVTGIALSELGTAHKDTPDRDEEVELDQDPSRASNARMRKSRSEFEPSKKTRLSPETAPPSPIEQDTDMNGQRDDDPDYADAEEISSSLSFSPPKPVPAAAPIGSRLTKRARPPSTTTGSRRASDSGASDSTDPAHLVQGESTRGSDVERFLPPPVRARSTKSARSDSVSSGPVPLTTSQKRQNHIESEQRRRNLIKVNFKDLVELVISGQPLSHIILGPDIPRPTQLEPAAAASEDEVEGASKKRTKKGSTRGSSSAVVAAPRGRGRKGDTGANASKSVVLEKARDYIQWLERGNQAIERELDRVESLLGPPVPLP
ncbi:uncharacterized protein JCM15063_000951 [Sporobolomyces koalae]|uniref:uncharacterized protein n=1 Tax=Sporobolomyces koalae TaxID=500713 RepID=UPI00316F00F3